MRRRPIGLGDQPVGRSLDVAALVGFAPSRVNYPSLLRPLLPKNTRIVRGFLGLAGYYHRFIRNFDTIAAPLTALLRK